MTDDRYGYEIHVHKTFTDVWSPISNFYKQYPDSSALLHPDEAKYLRTRIEILSNTYADLLQTIKERDSEIAEYKRRFRIDH